MSVHDYASLYAHRGHRVVIAEYGDHGQDPDNVAIECVDCNEVLSSYDRPPAEATYEVELFVYDTIGNPYAFDLATVTIDAPEGLDDGEILRLAGDAYKAQYPTAPVADIKLSGYHFRELEQEADLSDARRSQPGVCGKCGGACQFDADGNPKGGL